DRHQIERLNSLYRIIDETPAGGGLKARLASSLRRLLGRVLSRQQEFNAVVVDHLNRNMSVGAEAHHASLRTIDWIGGAVDRCEGAKDEIQRHLEALLARERRNDTAVAALAAQHEELRAALSVVQQAAHGLRRAVEEIGSTPNAQLPPSNSQADPGSLADPGSRLPGRDPAARRGLPANLPGRRRARRRLRARRVPRPAARAWHPRARRRRQSRDGGGVPGKGAGGGNGRRADLPARPAGRVTGRAVRGAGGRAPRAALPGAAPRRRVREAAPGGANRARNDQPGVLVRVLRELHPRPDARAPRASRHAEIPADRHRVPACRDQVSRALPGGREAAEAGGRRAAGG